MKNFLATRKYLSIIICLFLPVLPVFAENCTNSNAFVTSPKIKFDLSPISEAGLIGQKDGLRAVNYEFCIPAKSEALTKVQTIDPTIQYSQSRGRIGCQKDQYLIIGSTHQNNWRRVLLQLASLDYI